MRMHMRKDNIGLYSFPFCQSSPLLVIFSMQVPEAPLTIVLPQVQAGPPDPQEPLAGQAAPASPPLPCLVAGWPGCPRLSSTPLPSEWLARLPLPLLHSSA